MNAENCPTEVRDSIHRYIDAGIKPGSFVLAVLCNQLWEAFAKADSVNRELIGDIVEYVNENVPAKMWGSVEQVERHLK